MASRKKVFTATLLLSLAVGLYLLLSGLQTLIDFDSATAKLARAFSSLLGADQSTDQIAVAIAVFKILAGTVLIVGPFGVLPFALRTLAFWIIGTVWLLILVWNFALTGHYLQPTVMTWLQDLALNLAILAALWSLKPEKSAPG
jgi:hypothetical protein